MKDKWPFKTIGNKINSLASKNLAALKLSLAEFDDFPLHIVLINHSTMTNARRYLIGAYNVKVDHDAAFAS